MAIQYVNEICSGCGIEFKKTLRLHNLSVKAGTKHIYCSREYKDKYVYKHSERNGNEFNNLLKRFWERLDKETPYGPNGDCWQWKGKLDKGYGVISYESRMQQAHRISWKIHNKQDIPEGLIVMHSCDMPDCVNPAHLSTGTKFENNEDKRLKGRQTKGQDSASTPLTNEDVIWIRENYKDYKYKDLAAKFNIGKCAIANIVNNRTWTHLPLSKEINKAIYRENPVLTDKQIEDFWSKVNKTEDCWFWLNNSYNTYGKFYTNNTSYCSNRISFILANGQNSLSETDVVRHTCRNRRCVNPNHLEKGTHADNTRDKIERDGGLITPTAKVTEEQVREIRKLRLSGQKLKDIAAKYGIAEYTVYSICAKRTWKHVD